MSQRSPRGRDAGTSKPPGTRRSIRLSVALDETKEELAELKSGGTETQSGMVPQPGWLVWRQGAASRPALVKPDRPPEIEVRIGNCLDLIEPEENVYDAIVTDPPYALALHGYDWDSDSASCRRSGNASSGC